MHASNVALVLNLSTMRISLQYHVVFDDAFATVQPNSSALSDEWENLYRNNRELYADPTDHDGLNDLPFEWREESEETTNYDSSRIPENKTVSRNLGSAPPDTSQIVPSKPEISQITDPIDNDSSSKINDNFDRNKIEKNIITPSEKEVTSTQNTGEKSLEPHLPRRSSRINKGKTTSFKDYDAYTSELAIWTIDSLNELRRRVHRDHPHAFLSDFRDDIPSLWQALKQADSHSWIQAMKKEIRQLEDHGTWSIKQKHLVPKDATILDSIWALKKKRRPDGTLLKYKARLCVRGDQQVLGESFWDVYAPVVAWPLVRILLILSSIHNYHTRHVDFMNAFAQADLKETIYIRPPACFGMKNRENVLLLHKSLYGLRQAARVWYLRISSALKELKFACLKWIHVYSCVKVAL